LVGEEEFEKMRWTDEQGKPWVEGKSEGEKEEAWEEGIDA